MESKQKPNSCPSPSPNLPSSSLLRDISNFRTPNHPSQNPSFHSPYSQFFNTSKNTPRSSAFSSSSLRSHRRPTTTTSMARSKAARRLKAFELEQSKSARKAQISKEKSLQSLAKSLTVWLNFLFQSPESCGVDVSKFTRGDEGRSGKSVVSETGKRDSWHASGVRVDRPWRVPKRQRDSSWRGVVNVDSSAVSSSTYVALKSSLSEVCSFDDLKERMSIYLSLTSCKEIFDVMTLVTKNIDEGRIKMKAHCPIVTDVGMKEKAMRILMCYNPIWLRIGLYMILGGDFLLPRGDIDSEHEVAFLKMVIEKQFFSHTDLAKAYAYNKMVEGLYRPGYFDKLGNVLLKRFLLLVLVLDRAKSQSSLPPKYGIDGLDGGSPLLFTLESTIKSNCQVIHDLLSSDVMHGEGNLLAHLVIVGYKVSYQQSPLIEYDFRVTDLFKDLQDGVRLCRVIQLLQHDSSILMKIVVPSDSRKKNLVNCGIALQYLKQAAVSLCDEDGAVIMGEDVVNEDKELVVSLLWNIFVYLQLPLLLNRRLLSEEISKIHGVDVVYSNTSNLLDLLLSWIQAICENYDLRIENFSSLIDGKAMWCLLDHYFRKYHCSCSSKDFSGTNKEASIMSTADYTDAVHNFILSQKLTSLLGNFPEVLQVSDILEHNGACNDRSVIILLVFLSFQFLVKRNVDQLNFHKLLGSSCQSPEYRRPLGAERWFMHSESVLNQEGIRENRTEEDVRSFKAIMAWWQEMAWQNNKSDLQPATLRLPCLLGGKGSTNIQKENAAKIIQSHFRRLMEHRNYLRVKNAVSMLQAVVRAWLTVKKLDVKQFARWKQSETFGRYMTFMLDRHDFVNLKRSAFIIQCATRAWMSRKHQSEAFLLRDMSNPGLINAAIVVQKCIRGWAARTTYIYRVSQIEKASSHHSAATKIQSYYRGWGLRKSFLNQKQAALKIQKAARYFKCWKDFQQMKLEIKSVIIIQSQVRGWIARREASRKMIVIVLIQCHCRGWLTRRELSFQKKAVIKIQRAFQCMKCRKTFIAYRHAATEMQQFDMGQITRKRLLGAHSLHRVAHVNYIGETSSHCVQSLELKILLQSLLKLQRWWRGFLSLKSKTNSAIIIQSYIRGWIARRRVTRERQAISVIVIQSHIRRWLARQRTIRERQRIVMIQSYWKGYLARKDSRWQLLDLRTRVQKSAANVDDSMRIINRLIAALTELLNMKSVSGILHICATLDMATEHSQKCCEKLVEAGAVDTLLKQIRSVSRSIPDQEVLKHALSTLKNLARYPHLTDILIDSHGLVEAIFWEFLRNKEAYFVASELLRKICSNQKGVEAIRKMPALLKRLHNLVEDLSRKAGYEKRNARSLLARENVERRLAEATGLLNLITNR